MRKVGKAALSLALLGCVLGARAAPVEHPAAINGTGEAAVFAAFDGSGGSPITSFLRFFDGGSSATTFSITIVGSQTGQTYGHPFTLQIPSLASPQYSLGQLLALAGSATGAGVANGDTSFALFITDSDATAGYQHVTFNSVTTLFENNSICNNGLLSAAYVNGTGQNVLTNVHTTTLSGYPSVIYFYNYSNAPVTAPVTIYDAGLVGADGKTPSATAGKQIGSTTIQIPANGLVTKQFSDLQTSVNWTPTSSQLHANVVVAKSSSTNPVILVHSITNVTLGGSINMSNACAVNAASGGSSGGSSATATTTYQGTIAGSDGASGTLSVTVNATVASNAAALSAVERPQAVSQASGALLLSSGTTISLTGTYNPSTNAISITGSGYSFSGNISSGVFSGSYTGPNNSGGQFSALSGTQSSITAYCGTFSGGGQGNKSGVFNFVVSASGGLSGLASDGTIVSGHITGSSLTAQGGGSNITGTIQGGSLNATFLNDANPPGTGTISGSACSLPLDSGSGSGSGSGTGSGSGSSTTNLSLTVAGNGSGSITTSPAGITCTNSPGAVCNGTFSAGTAVTLTPSPASATRFTGWSGACSGTGACVVTITNALQSVTGTFTVAPTLTTSLAPSGTVSGTITSSPAGINCGAASATACSYQFGFDTAVTLTANPGSGNTFGGWSGACSGPQISCVVNLASSSESVTATFNVPSFTYSLNFSGSFDGPTGQGSAGSGNILFSPGGIAGGPCAVGTGSCNWGLTSGQNGALTYTAGTTVTLTPSPAIGTFVGWGGDCSGTGSCTLTMNANKTVTATFHGTCNPTKQPGSCTP